MSRPLRVAVVGAGPAGIYASDLLMKSDTDVQIDLFERMPAPFGLIRYGVAPDHPRIKGIVKSLHNVMDKEQLRFLGNIEVGKDITVEELREFYDAIVFSTGATGDQDLRVPGSDLEGSWGAGEFVGFYDGNPNFERNWDLSAEKVAVVGVGNVALDVARILAKTGDELLVTEIPDNVYESLAKNQAKEVHVFGRRGPAQAKFTPLELKELDHSDTIEVIVNPEDIDYDAASEQARRDSKSQDLVCQTLESYAMRDPKGAPHKLFIHFFESPVEILGEDGKVVGLKTERTQLDGNGGVTGTGEFKTWDMQSVYRAVGYRSDAIEGVPFDDERAVVPNDGGHIIDPEVGSPITGLYATGWIKRGPIGLIGNTKSDAKETTEMLLADHAAGSLPAPAKPELESIIEFLDERKVAFTTWDGWHLLDAAERALGEPEGRERKKIVEWNDMVRHARPEYDI
ncbi:ferredoxin-NADP(+) reductase [Corynebacterium glutamicum MB001]|uniref:ferredoxin--NADP(+) reductase n=1 Tax=Corynebacterium glutamicum (strain ATCC 13032 / DSM 20300 / JCM 1318 / BCRC 11384 / CCUG 27702 / LMG 3730 / NBRC 12168 / NCIMB 10025 / NRRL B-2784 / 534) TaxID=196627 RepID=Q8NM28_CORGL|nr:FAD-dependent oxidoreductase [Corynebacterium glutamicum]AGT06467.1 ferredoxin-NADP(+) reductase [Corynebacterium glutamicum MB001]ARV66044.1 pyridine nucleotide-disulfide oxidoreductase [Corynebacterium glutamicum]ASW15066.1 ferredoxin-NADP(+) reductase [Corynebacterium glutamicum]AUI02141.1 pyridine nucleotide-disulfide oxidoreductase [Corynebacterium glutamicum]AUI02957.1 pyridine nucleotide-disulfide oxidoreductase [Corynebacterium glutamicum]